VRWQKNSSFGFFCVGFSAGKNQMCCLCGWLFLIGHNVSAMVSTGIKSSELSIKHLAKTFSFCFTFLFLKPNQKDLADLVKCIKFWLSTKTRINYSHC
jgi:hypothetical protein